MEHLDTFLSLQPPFDGLPPAELSALATRAREVSFDTGELVLVEDGIPAEGLYVLTAGSMELVHEGEPMVVLEPGECFGHPSLLSGMAPLFTVRARSRRCAHCWTRRERAACSARRPACATWRGRCARA